MSRSHHSHGRWLVAVSLLSLAFTACANWELSDEGTVQLTVSADELTFAPGMQVQLPAGEYEIEGSAATDDTPDGLTLRGAVRITDANGERLFERPLTLPAPEGSRAGDRWSGEVTLHVQEGDVQAVSLPMRRPGRRPDAHADVDVTLNEAPDIRFVAISPDPVTPGGDLRATVVVWHREDPERLVVTIDAGDGEIALDPAESMDDGVRFEGLATAPLVAGPFDVRVTAIDPFGGETVDTKHLVVGDPEQAAAVERPDPVHDVAGLLVPAQRTLFVIPEDRDNVLEALGAEALGDGVFTIDADDGQAVQFVVEEDAVPALAGEVRAAARQPDLIEETTRTRVYKNARCGPAGAAFRSVCMSTEDGGSYQRHWEAWSRCIRGDAYCVERSAVVGQTKTYDLADCAPPVTSSRDINGWACR